MKSQPHRFLKTLLASAVLVTSFCIAGPVQAATVTGTHGMLQWSSADGATATITGCDNPCNYKVLNIPSTVQDAGGNTYSVTRFNGLGSGSVEKISLPDSVVTIPTYSLGNFTDIIFGKNVTSIPIQFSLANLATAKFKGNAPTVDYRVFNSATSAFRLAIGTGFGSGSLWRPAVSEGATLNVAEWQLEAPTAPTDLAVALGARSASISFTHAFDNGSEIARYEYSLDNGAWTTASQPVPLGPIVISGLTVGTTYSVKLRAVNNVGAGAGSAAVTFVGSDVPNAPTNVGVHIDDGEWLYITFDKVVDNGNPITNVQYSFNDGGTWTTANTTQNPIVVRFKPDNLSHSLKVRAVNVVGTGASSETVTTQTISQSKTGTFGRLTWRSIDGVTAMITGCPPVNDDPCPYKVLNVPSTVKDSDGKSYRVTRIANYGIAAGQLEKVNIPDSVVTIGGYGIGGTPLTTVIFGSGLTLMSYALSGKPNLTALHFKGNAPFIDYRTFDADAPPVAYRLAGATGFGNGSRWRPAVDEGPTLNVAEWQGPEAPSAPTDLVVTLGNLSASISFTDAFNNGSEITRYEYTTNNGATWTTFDQPSYLTPLVLSGLTKKTTYQVKLRAVNSVGVGASSAAATFVARDVPDAPVISSAIWDGWLGVNFTEGDNNGSAITRYEYSVDNGTTWLSTINGNPFVESPFFIPPPGDETTYVLKLRAVSAAGTGASSSSLTVRKPSEAVTGTYGRLNWSSWDGVSATITGCTENSCPMAVNIPSTVKGIDGTVYRVTRINSSAFVYGSLEKLSIPDSVTAIASFGGYSELKTISIGNGVKEMVGSFQWIQKLQTVMFKGNAPSEPSYTFWASGNFTAYRLAGATGFGNGTTWTDGNRTINVATYELAAPEAPTDLVIAPANSSLSVSFNDGFNNGSEISGYEYSVNNGVTWATATQSVPMGPIVITGLTNGVTYQVKLRAMSVVGAGVGSAAVEGRPESVPSAPTNVVVTRGNQSLSISFSTAAVALEKISNYEYSIDNGVTWVTLDPVAVSGPIVISGLTNGTRYQVKLRAVNNMGVGAGSVAVVGRPATVPSAPTSLVATPSDASLSISLTAGAINGEEITNYEYSINDGATWTAASPSVVSGPVVIRGLTNGTSYTVKLRAVNAAGSGASSVGVTGRPVAVPSAPTNVVVTRGDQSLSVAFTPAAPNGEVVTNYEYSINDGGTWTAASPSVVAGPIVISGLTNGTRYPVKLRAINAVGKGPASNSVTGRPAIAPAAPTNLVATRDDASLSIAFTAGANNGEELTRYQYSIDNGATWARVPGGDIKSPVRITGLTNGTTYSVLLRAVNDVGGGVSSAAVTGKPREALLADSAGTDVLIIKDPAPTIAAKSDLAVKGTKIYIALVTPQALAKVKAPVSYYQFVLTPKKKGGVAIRQTYRVLPDGKTTAILTGKPKTSYSLTVTAITSSGTRKSWNAPVITTQ